MNINAEVKDYKGKDGIYLSAGKYSAIIAPFNGSNIQEMRDNENDIEFFRKDDSFTYEDLKKNPVVYGFPTLLYHNRLCDGVLKASDYTYTFPIVDKEGHNSLHGFLHERDHSIVSAEVVDGKAIAKTEYVYDENDPFWEILPIKFKVEFTFTLSEDGMDYALTVTNLSDRQMPYGVCNHTTINGPFMTNADPLDTRLYITISERWPLTERNLPTGETVPLDNHDKQYQTGSIIPVKQDIDNDVYTMDNGEADGETFRGAIISDTKSGKQIRYEVDDNFKFWCVWNDSGDKGYFCPEPMTWMIDAPNLAMPNEESGYQELKPGESKTVREKLYTVTK